MADEQKANVVLTADNRQYDSSMQQSARYTGTLVQSVMALSDGMNKLATSAGKKIQLISAGGVAGLTAATVAAAKFDSQMSTMQANAVMTGRSYEKMAQDVNKLRGSFAVTTDQAIALQTQLAKMGQTAGVEKMAASMIKLGAVTGESVGALTQGMIGLQRQMGTTGSVYTEKFSSALANASAKAGVAATSVLDFSNSIAPISKVAGLSTKEVMGFSTAFVKAGQDGGTAATAFNKVLTDITRSVTYGSPELKAYSNLLGVSVKEFKAMPRSEAVIRVFEEINKQGPNALKTLERFGLDGPRTYKALQGMANQGGIRTAMADVAEGFNDPKKFNDAANKSMDGMNDQLQKLGNNLARVGQAFGTAFVGPLNGAIGKLNEVVAPLATMLESLGKIPGLAAAAATAFVGAVGLIVRSLGALTGLAAFRAVTGGTTAAGFRMARAGVNGTTAPAFARRAAADYERDAAAYAANPMAGHRLRGMQRFTYAMGRNIGAMLPASTGAGGPNVLSRAATATIRGFGAFTRSGLEPLYWNNVRNPFNTARGANEGGLHVRDRLGETWRTTQNFGLGAREMFNRAGSMLGNDTTRQAENAARAESLRAQRAANAGLNESARAARKQVGVFETLVKETVQLGKAMASAGAGAARMGLAGAGKAIPAVGSGIKSLLGATMGFLGPVGIAMAVGGTALSAYQHQKNEKQKNLLLGEEAESTDSVTGPYKVALGEAARATTTFADIVKKNASAMDHKEVSGLVAGQKPGVISDEMYKEARTPGHDYANARIGSMNFEQARQFMRSGLFSDKDRIVAGYDLSKRFSRDQAQKLMDEQSSLKGGIDLNSLYSGLSGTKGALFWKSSTDESQAATKAAAATGKEDLNEIQNKYGAASAAQYQISTLNAASAKRVHGGNLEQIYSALSSGIGTKVDDEGQRDFKYLFDPTFKEDAYGRRTQTAATFKDALERYKATPDQFKSQFAQTLAAMGENSSSRADLTATTWAPGQGLAMPLKDNPLPDVPVAMQQQLRSAGALGNAVMSKSAIGGLINEAMASPADANAQQRAMRGLADVAVTLTGDFSDAQGELQRLKNAAGDTSDTFYGLAANAQAVVAQRQQESIAWNNSRAGQTQALTNNFIQAKSNTLNNPGPESEQEFEGARKSLQENLQSGKDYFKQLYVQLREFHIGQTRAQDAFNLQKSNQDHDFNLARERQEEDYQRGRKRQEDGYERQLKRQVRDYNLSRKHAQEDFNISRKRSEEDYQHQVVLMTEAAAKQIYNIYDRVNVARTWSAQNLMANVADQQKRMEEQTQNLGQLRGMGISSDVIKMLGLNESQNAQQLARFVQDLLEDPAMVKQWNDAAKARLKASKAIVTDQDNTQWQEMERSFKLNADHAVEDFGRSMDRQRDAFRQGLADSRTEFNISTAQATDDYNRAREHQLTDYNTSVTRMVAMMALQQKHARDDLARNIEEITMDMDELADKSIKALGGVAATQMKNLKTQLDTAAGQIKSIAKTLTTDVANLFKNWQGVTGVTSGGVDAHGSGGASTQGHQTKWAADGGYISGWSPHPKADNIPARLTAGEYVHKVDAVSHYGQGFMDAVNNKRFPKEAAQHYATGGLVQFGKRLQGMDYDVSEHPAFGGVHPVHAKNSWHYKAGAIDVNHDQGSEKAAINAIISMARSYGLRTIWQVADHFDHAHFDIGAGPDMIGPGVPTGPRSQGKDPILDAVKNLKSYKKWEEIRGANYGLNRNIPKNALAEIIAQSFMSPGSGDLHMPTPSKGNAGANASLGRTMAATRGWVGPQWEALNWIYMKESGWNQFADNPTSDAYGIPQALPGNKMASAGMDWKTNPATQIKWGLGYIAERYGNPMKAQEFWKAHNWYGDGAIFAGGGQKVTGVGERGPEVILPLDQRGVDYLLAVMRQFSGPEAKAAVGVSRGVPCQSHGATNYYSRIDRSTQIHGPITVQSQDPRDMLRKLEGEKRIAALTSPRRSS